MNAPLYKVTCVNAITREAFEAEKEFQEECNYNNGALMYDHEKSRYILKQVVRVGIYRMLVKAIQGETKCTQY